MTEIAQEPIEKRYADDLARVLREIHDQPAWRAVADKEMDYRDGNQLDSETLQALEENGIPPAIENMVGPVHEDYISERASVPLDIKIEANDPSEQASDMADAMTQKMAVVEEESNMDKACLAAFEPQSGVGIGWVEVSRETNPFRAPYRCNHVHRNEIFWDMLSREEDLSDARWLLRRRWTNYDEVLAKFPAKANLIKLMAGGWAGADDLALSIVDGGGDTGLFQSLEIERGWAIEESEWRLPDTNRVAVFELNIRRLEQVFVFNYNGKVVELDESNQDHLASVVQPEANLHKASVYRVYRQFFLGPHFLLETKGEFGDRFAYVPFWGRREDRTLVPYGILRWLVYLQDEINARVSKMKWQLSAKRVERTEGAVAMTDEEFADEINRPDADIILNPLEMAKPGARFTVQSDVQLTEQQFKRYTELRQVIRAVADTSQNMIGQNKGGYSSSSEELYAVLDKTTQGRARINSNYVTGRQEVAERLLTLVLADSTGEETVIIKKRPIADDRIIVLNKQEQDENGEAFLTNDLSRLTAKVKIVEVNASPSYKKQQLVTMQEAFKSSPAQYQEVMMPHLLKMLDVGNADDIIEAIMKLKDQNQITQEQLEQAVKEAEERVRGEVKNELEARKLDIQEKKTDAEIAKIISETIENKLDTIFSAVKTAEAVAINADLAPATDQILQSAGFDDADDAPIVDVVGPITVPDQITPINKGQMNTSPLFPSRIDQPEVPEQDMAGPIQLPPASDGMMAGIEGGEQPQL